MQLFLKTQEFKTQVSSINCKSFNWLFLVETKLGIFNPKGAVVRKRVFWAKILLIAQKSESNAIFMKTSGI